MSPVPATSKATAPTSSQLMVSGGGDTRLPKGPQSIGALSLFVNDFELMVADSQAQPFRLSSEDDLV